MRQTRRLVTDGLAPPPSSQTLSTLWEKKIVGQASHREISGCLFVLTVQTRSRPSIFKPRTVCYLLAPASSVDSSGDLGMQTS